MPQGPFTYGCIAIAAVLIMLAGCSVGGVTARGGPVAATLSKGHQVVGAAISASAYPTIIVQKGVPVQWTLNARKGDLSDCNQTIVVPGLGIRKTLVSGANLVEFKAERAGVIPYSCWMGMIAGRIVVVENLSAPLPQAAFAPSQVCRVPTGERLAASSRRPCSPAPRSRSDTQSNRMSQYDAHAAAVAATTMPRY